jgi:Asp-tRNA(Asn)/Glu-tRNA(Gln) amidotransferase A subunit family amidase
MQSLTLDTVGWYGRSVADLALLCELYAIEDDPPERSFSLRGSRIAVCQSAAWKHADRATRDALAKGAALLKAAGAETVDLTLPEHFARLVDDQVVIQNSEGRAAFLSEHRIHHAGLHEELRRRVENRDGLTRDALRRAYDRASQCRVEFEEICAGFDAVLTPSAPGEAPLGFETTGWDIFNRTWSVLHAPVINVPGFYGPSGLPVGLSVTGPRFSDQWLLKVAAEIGRCFAGPGRGPA